MAKGGREGKCGNECLRNPTTVKDYFSTFTGRTDHHTVPYNLTHLIRSAKSTTFISTLKGCPLLRVIVAFRTARWICSTVSCGIVRDVLSCEVVVWQALRQALRHRASWRGFRKIVDFSELFLLRVSELSGYAPTPRLGPRMRSCSACTRVPKPARAHAQRAHAPARSRRPRPPSPS